VVEVGRSVPSLGPPAVLFRLRRLWPVLVLIVALAPRLWGIGWQLPAAMYFDEMKYVAWASDAKNDASQTVTDLRNPTLFHHLLQIEYAVAALVQRGATQQQVAVSELWLARVTSAVLGSLACVLTALAAHALTRAIGCRRDALVAGLSAGLILAVAPLHVHLSHYAVNDTTASFFLAAALYFGTRVLAGGSRRDLVLAGLTAGLGFSTKYSFAIGLALPLVVALVGRNVSLTRRAADFLAVLAAFVVGAAVGAPEFILSPDAVLAGVAEQARLGGIRWNGQSDAPIWQLYLDTLVQGLGWPALLLAAIGCVTVGWRSREALVAELSVLALCLGVMLRQELFFARFALPLLSWLALLAGPGVMGAVRLAVHGRQVRPALMGGLAAVVLAVALLPEIVTTVRHDQLATTTDTRVLARRWLTQRGDGARVATELYGQPLLWAGSVLPRGFRLQRVGSFVEPTTVSRLACDGTRLFLVSSLTSEREIARRGPRAGETGYDLLARLGQVRTILDPFQPGKSAPAHPDNTGIPFWFLDDYARPGPKITIYELPDGAVSCPR
jgi:4-amino-4-deoxy-L-arabinose transferase-like glycosyltransferase